MNIMVMSGTKDAFNIIKKLANNESFHEKLNIIATTTTDYGAAIAKKTGANKVILGQLNENKIANVMDEYEVDLLIDATHPFASNATKNAIEATKKLKIEYVRFDRPPLNKIDNNKIHTVRSFEETIEKVENLLKKEDSNYKIMHLAGVSNLKYLVNKFDKQKICVRVLPSLDSISKCLTLGINPENIIAMQGTFSKEFNKELMKEYGASIIITKESGLTGGTPSKISAALELGLDIVIIERPQIKELDKKRVFNNIDELLEYISTIKSY